MFQTHNESTTNMGVKLLHTTYKKVINIEELYKVLHSVISMTNYQNFSLDDEWRWKVGVCDAILTYMVTLNYNLNILSCRFGGGHKVHF